MRGFRWAIILLAPLLAASAPEARRLRPIGEAEGLFPYRFEWGERRFDDIVTLRDGARLLGKVMEWADQVLVFGSGCEAEVLEAADVASFEFRRGQRQSSRPDLADLTVAWVERLPRDPSWQGRVEMRDGLPCPAGDKAGVTWHPKPGDGVTFRVHVLNAGPAKSVDGNCRVRVDGAEIASVALPAIEPGAEFVVEASWPWAEGRQMLRVELSTRGDVPEIQKWNNTFDEPIHALAVVVVVAADRDEAFTRSPNAVDSFCFADWVQHQLRCFNALLRASVYPTAAKGAVERVRCDRIIVEEHPLSPAAIESRSRLLRQGGRADGLAEYAALLVFPAMADNEVGQYSSLKVNWRQLQALAAQLGLVDLRRTDTTIEQNMVLNAREEYVCRQHLFPWPETLMYTAGPFTLSKPDVGYLNAALGKPRGFRGEYLYQLPQKIKLRVLSNAGTRLEGVQVEAYQLHGDGPYAGTICGYGRDPLFAAFTDAEGQVVLQDQDAPSHRTPNGYELRPNPFGRILTDGSNGLLMIRLLMRGQAFEEYYFLRLFDLNVAFLQGDRTEFVRELRTRFPTADAPNAPPWAPIVMDDRGSPHPPMTVQWRFPHGSNTGNTEEFRVYKRTSLGGDDVKPWTLSSVVRRSGQRWSLMAEGTYFDEFRDDGAYSLDTFFAVTTVDKQGRESGLVESPVLAWKKRCLKFAIDVDDAYITLDGPGPVQMLKWNGQQGTQVFGVRTNAIPRYQPSYSGIAVSPEHRLVVTDPRNHVLAFYDRKGNLEEVSPARDWWPGFASRREGEFNMPLDVAVDLRGRLYVADYGNNRVQVLDGRGAFLYMLDGSFAFNGPHAVAFGNGHLCVTDRAGSRMRVYDCKGEKPVFVRQLPDLIGADRGIVNRSGNIILTGRVSESADTAILSFRPSGTSATFDTSVEEVEMGKLFRPRGMYLYLGLDGDYVFLVNDFPFDVRRYKIEPNSPDSKVVIP